MTTRKPVSTSTGRPRTRRGPGRPKGGQLLADRAQLLEAANAVISARGPGVTMEEIAAEASVTKPILYRTIGDRAALVHALSDALVDRIIAEIEHALIGQREPSAQFEATVRGYLTAITENRNLFLFVNAGRQETDELRRLVERSAQPMIALFLAVPTLARADAAAARTWAYAILGAFQIVTVMWLDDEYCDLDTMAGDLTGLLWPGIARARQG